MTNQYQTSNDPLYDIRNIISQIEEKSASGNYIYRGEPEHHEEPPYYGKYVQVSTANTLRLKQTSSI